MAPDCSHNTTGTAFIATQEFLVTYCLTFVFFILFVVPFRVHFIDISRKLLYLHIFTGIFMKTFCVWNIIIGLYWAAHECGHFQAYTENWQVASVMCSCVAMACDVLLVVAMIVFLLNYHKTMQAMLTAFLQINTKNTGIQSVQADQIGRSYPPFFTLNLPKEEEIMDDLREITAMEYVVQALMIVVCITIVIVVMYFCCMKCRHTCTIFKYCFPFLLISHIVCTSRHADLFVEVTDVAKGN